MLELDETRKRILEEDFAKIQIEKKYKDNNLLPLKRINFKAGDEVTTKILINDISPGTTITTGYIARCPQCNSEIFVYTKSEKYCNALFEESKCQGPKGGRVEVSFESLSKTGYFCVAYDPEDMSGTPQFTNVFFPNSLIPDNEKERTEFEIDIQNKTLLISAKMNIMPSTKKIIDWYLEVESFEFEKRKVEIDKDLLFKYKNLERDDLFFKDYYAPKVFCKLLQKKVSAVTIFSPLKVEMPNGSVEWAVSNVIEMGDPGQAKTILEVENLKYMQGTLSKLISVENSTMRGLIGAAIRNVQTGRWMVKVGDIPKRNGEYVVLDGFGMLAQEDCAQLRGIQEEKKFQINKAGSIEKECAVRMKCIANLVNPVSEYTTKHKATYDVSATTSDRRNKFSGADRRRFHHVLVVGDDDVLAKDIDMHLHKSYNPEKDKELIQYWNNLREFAWDLQPDSFIWKEGVDEYSIGKVNHLRTRYSNFLLDYAILSKKGSTCFLTQLPAVAIIHNSITPKMTVEIKKEHVDWLYSLYEEEFRDLGLSLENERRKFQELQADGILLSCPKKTIEYLALIWKCGSKSSVEESGKVSRRTLYRTFDAIISYQMITLQLKNGKEIEDPEEFHYSFNTGSGEIENKNKKNKTPISLIPDNVLPPINKRDGTLTPFGKILIQKAYHMHFSKLDKIKIKGVYQQ